MWLPGTYEDTLTHARFHVLEGELEEAVPLYERLIERLAGLKPEIRQRRPELSRMYRHSLAELARAHHVLGNFERALELYRQLSALEDAEQSVWRRSAAQVLIDMGRVEQGLDELRAEAVANPGDHVIWLLMGYECLYLKRWQEAEENLQRALRSAVTPEQQLSVHLGFFALHRMQGHVEEALAIWERAWQGKKEGANNSLVYRMLIEHGQLERARRYLEREPNALRRGFYQGLLDRLQGKAQEAQRHWQRVAKMNPFEFENSFAEWAEAALRIDWDPAEVVNVLNRFEDAGDTTPRGMVLWAIAAARLGRTDEVERALERGRLIVRRMRPRRERLSAEEWQLFDELVSDAAIKNQFKHFFEASQNDASTS
ncbi:MAG: hypothetical protein NZ765_01880 [Anaerolineae bacterium]|nr:hypothetical protein [Anaerolineae bacterium]MDW8070308.1 hypothetical protein [Anaerolineae bacterium]